MWIEVALDIAHGLYLIGGVEEGKKMSFALAESMFSADGAAECNGHPGEVDDQFVRRRKTRLVRGEQVHMQMGIADMPEDDELPREGPTAALPVVLQDHFIAVDRNREVGS